MQRTIRESIVRDLDEKAVFLSGPRQVGKTTLAKELFPKATHYLNFDYEEDRLTILKRRWDRKTSLVVFDELHKMKKWKSWLKGIYDVEGIRPRLMVTGSARLDTWKKGGDSMAGRHFSFRLHPFSVAELRNQMEPEKTLESLLRFGGFPEPFLKDSEVAAARWRKSHLDRILREDLLDLEQIRNLKGIEILVDLLSDRVGSPVSFRSLAQDLQVAIKTVQRWVELLERLYVVFVVTPYAKNVARSLLKEPKIYFYDTGRVKNDSGARFENVIACSLLKRNHFLEDTKGETRILHYIRDRQKREVDFVTVRNHQPEWLVEAKKSDDNASPSLLHFARQFGKTSAFQVVLDSHVRKGRNVAGIEIVEASGWLADFES